MDSIRSSSTTRSGGFSPRSTTSPRGGHKGTGSRAGGQQPTSPSAAPVEPAKRAPPVSLSMVGIESATAQCTTLDPDATVITYADMLRFEREWCELCAFVFEEREAVKASEAAAAAAANNNNNNNSGSNAGGSLPAATELGQLPPLAPGQKSGASMRRRSINPPTGLPGQRRESSASSRQRRNSSAQSHASLRNPTAPSTDDEAELVALEDTPARTPSHQPPDSATLDATDGDGAATAGASPPQDGDGPFAGDAAQDGDAAPTTAPVSPVHRDDLAMAPTASDDVQPLDPDALNASPTAAPPEDAPDSALSGAGGVSPSARPMSSSSTARTPSRSPGKQRRSPQASSVERRRSSSGNSAGAMAALPSSVRRQSSAYQGSASPIAAANRRRTRGPTANAPRIALADTFSKDTPILMSDLIDKNFLGVTLSRDTFTPIVLGTFQSSAPPTSAAAVGTTITGQTAGSGGGVKNEVVIFHDLLKLLLPKIAKWDLDRWFVTWIPEDELLLLKGSLGAGAGTRFFTPAKATAATPGTSQYKPFEWIVEESGRMSLETLSKHGYMIGNINFTFDMFASTAARCGAAEMRDFRAPFFECLRTMFPAVPEALIRCYEAVSPTPQLLANLRNIFIDQNPAVFEIDADRIQQTRDEQARRAATMQARQAGNAPGSRGGASGRPGTRGGNSGGNSGGGGGDRGAANRGGAAGATAEDLATIAANLAGVEPGVPVPPHPVDKQSLSIGDYKALCFVGRKYLDVAPQLPLTYPLFVAMDQTSNGGAAQGKISMLAAARFVFPNIVPAVLKKYLNALDVAECGAVEVPTPPQQQQPHTHHQTQQQQQNQGAPATSPTTPASPTRASKASVDLKGGAAQAAGGGSGAGGGAGGDGDGRPAITTNVPLPGPLAAFHAQNQLLRRNPCVEMRGIGDYRDGAVAKSQLRQLDQQDAQEAYAEHMQRLQRQAMLVPRPPATDLRSSGQQSPNNKSLLLPVVRTEDSGSVPVSMTLEHNNSLATPPAHSTAPPRDTAVSPSDASAMSPADPGAMTPSPAGLVDGAGTAISPPPAAKRVLSGGGLGGRSDTTASLRAPGTASGRRRGSTISAAATPTGPDFPATSPAGADALQQAIPAIPPKPVATRLDYGLYTWDDLGLQREAPTDTTRPKPKRKKRLLPLLGHFTAKMNPLEQPLEEYQRKALSVTPDEERKKRTVREKKTIASKIRQQEVEAYLFRLRQLAERRAAERAADKKHREELESSDSDGDIGGGFNLSFSPGGRGDGGGGANIFRVAERLQKLSERRDSAGLPAMKFGASEADNDGRAETARDRSVRPGGRGLARGGGFDTAVARNRGARSARTIDGGPARGAGLDRGGFSSSPPRPAPKPKPKAAPKASPFAMMKAPKVQEVKREESPKPQRRRKQVERNPIATYSQHIPKTVRKVPVLPPGEAGAAGGKHHSSASPQSTRARGGKPGAAKPGGKSGSNEATPQPGAAGAPAGGDDEDETTEASEAMKASRLSRSEL